MDASFIPNENEKALPPLTLIEPRQQGLEYYVDHHNASIDILFLLKKGEIEITK